MKQKQAKIVAGVSGAACAVCMALFMWSVQHQADEAHARALARYGGEQVETCVATRDIAAGEQLDSSALETRLWVASLLPDDAICDGKEVIGQTATTSIYKGEVIVAKRFHKKASDLDIPAGYQAVSVPVKTVQAVGGNIQPGTQVDVYATGDITTSVLMTNTLVLDTSLGDSSSGNGWITLAVEPKRVQEIVAAANRTSLYFTIPGDKASTDEQKASGSTPSRIKADEPSEQEGNYVSSNRSLS